MLINHLYETFKSMKLPSNKVMEDAVVEIGLDIDEAKRCVETFIVNAQYIGLIQMLSGAQRLISIEHLLEEMVKSNLPAGGYEISATSNCVGEAVGQIESQNDISYDKICFYITPIGVENSDERKHSDMLLECVVSPVLEEFGLKVVRADNIDKPGEAVNFSVSLNK